jgi:ankyrin repeat protein
VAAFHNNLDCMQLLLSHGASVETRDVTGKTPLLLAAYSGQCNAIGECSDHSLFIVMDTAPGTVTETIKYLDY